MNCYFTTLPLLLPTKTGGRTKQHCHRSQLPIASDASRRGGEARQAAPPTVSLCLFMYQSEVLRHRNVTKHITSDITNKRNSLALNSVQACFLHGLLQSTLLLTLQTKKGGRLSRASRRNSASHSLGATRLEEERNAMNLPLSGDATERFRTEPQDKQRQDVKTRMSDHELFVSQSNVFSGFQKPFEKANYIILGVPFDVTSTYRTGARFGPNAIRQASLNIETYSMRTGIDVEDLSLHDLGDLHVSANTEKTLQTLERVIKQHR